MLSVPPEEAFRILLDVPRVARCLPGVALESSSDSAHRGAVTVTVGPIALVFRGEAVLEHVDEANRRAVFRGRGSDQKGRGTAQAAITFAVVGEEAGSRVEVSTDLTLSGAVAQYGRGHGVMQAVMQQIVQGFVVNLEATVRASAPDETSVLPVRELSARALVWAAIKAVLARVRTASKRLAGGARSG